MESAKKSPKANGEACFEGAHPVFIIWTTGRSYYEQ